MWSWFGEYGIHGAHEAEHDQESGGIVLELCPHGGLAIDGLLQYYLMWPKQVLGQC